MEGLLEFLGQEEIGADEEEQAASIRHVGSSIIGSKDEGTVSKASCPTRVFKADTWGVPSCALFMCPSTPGKAER